MPIPSVEQTPPAVVAPAAPSVTPETAQTPSTTVPATSSVDSIHPAWLGCVLADSVDPRGARISQIYRGHPADSAGLKAGDVITRIDKTTVASVGDVASLIEDLAVASTVEIAVVRGGAEVTLRVTLAERPWRAL
jgi:S1-C subfamily serine protease